MFEPYVPQKIFLTSKDKEDIFETILSLMYIYITNNINSISLYDFETIFKDQIYNELMLQLSEIYSKDLDDEINKILNNCLTMFYIMIMPRRSQKSITTKINKYYIKQKLLYLKSLPQDEQRTEEWYKTRHNLITASNAWKCLDSEANKNQIIFEKCSPIKKFNFAGITSPLHWGVKYEPLSVLYYETKYNLKIEDFGCIIHNTYKFLGASPDGIVTSSNSSRYGRMLEIKNPSSREITGIPKKEYWIQVQLQMETCNLNECDFLETKFVEYENEDEYNKDTEFSTNNINKLKGKLICFYDDDKPYYEYPSLNFNDEDYLKWEKKIMEKNKKLTWIKTIYWKLPIVSCVLIYRNKLWFKNIINDIQIIWNTIEKERIEGYQHRISKKKKTNSPELKGISTPICLINIDTEKLEDANTNL